MDKLTTTSRGFHYLEFTDRYDELCSIQKSSLAGEDCIRLGPVKPDIRYLKCQYAEVGLPRPEGELVGHEEYPLPEKVSATSRMHLTRDQVAQLLPLLQRFVKTGELDGQDT